MAVAQHYKILCIGIEMGADEIVFVVVGMVFDLGALATTFVLAW